jgi:hypothetical protein
MHREVKKMKTLSLRRKLLFFGAPVVLVGAGLTTLAASAATPTATPSAQQQAEKPGTGVEAAEPAEAGETADSAAELAAEKALPGGGHADSETDANADHQFEGVE